MPPSSPAHAGWAGALSPWMPDPRALLPAASLAQLGGGHTACPQQAPSPITTREPSASQVSGPSTRAPWPGPSCSPSLGLPSVREASGQCLLQVEFRTVLSVCPVHPPLNLYYVQAQAHTQEVKRQEDITTARLPRGQRSPRHSPSSGGLARTGLVVSPALALCVSPSGHFKPVASGSMASEVTPRSPPESPDEPGLCGRLAGRTLWSGFRVRTRVVSGLQATAACIRAPALPVECQGLCVEGTK